MKFSELYRVLENDGWYIEKTKKHHLYVQPIKNRKSLLGNMARKK
jgi:hypothetical protein